MPRFRREISTFVSENRYALILWGLYAIAALLTFFVQGNSSYGPVHQGDEDRYWNMAFEMYRGTFNFVNNHMQPPLYPISILPAFFFYPQRAYLFVKLLNALYFTSVIFPIYLILKRYLTPGLSLAVCLAVLFNPAQLVIPRLILSENLYFPLLMWAVYLSTLRIPYPRYRFQFFEHAFLGALFASLVATRYISLIIVPMLLLIWWLKPYPGDQNRLLWTNRKFIQFLVILVSFGLILGIWIFLGVREGLEVRQVMGFEIGSDSNPLQLTFSRLIMWSVFYISYVILMAAPVLGILAFSLKKSRLSEWRNELPRWILSIGLLLVSFLIGCIRHSWINGYNYPDPMKLQGRYLLYFGPLFLMTAVMIVKNQYGQIGRSNPWLFGLKTIVMISLFCLSYGILFMGLIYLGRPLDISISSPDGYLFGGTGKLYLIFCAILAFLTILLVKGKQQWFFICFFPLYIGFLFFGNLRIYNKVLLPQQFYPIQAYHLIEAFERENPVKDYPENIPVLVGIEKGNQDVTIEGRWLSTLYAYGYRNIEFVEEPRLSGEAEAYNFIKIGGIEYRIDGIDEKGYLTCQCEKYELMGKFYTVMKNQ